MTYHNPVLLSESINGLNIKPNGVYVDVTFGGGGHSKEIIKNIISSLDIKINSITESNLGLSIPNYRNDVKREADVIEEISPREHLHLNKPKFLALFSILLKYKSNLSDCRKIILFHFIPSQLRSS